MKKFSAIIMSFVMAFTFASCEKEKGIIDTSEAVGTAAVDTSVTHTTVTENTTEETTEITTEKATESTSATPVIKPTAAPKTTKKVAETTASENKTVTTVAVTEKPTSPTTAGTTASSSQISVVTDSDIAKIKKGFLKLVNKERAKKGAQPLRNNSALNAAANIRSRELLENFSHTRPDGQPFHSALSSNGYTIYNTGENIQYTSHLSGDFTDKNDLFTGRNDQIVAAYTLMFDKFKNSPDHYSNMMNKNFCDTGIGISYNIHKESGLAIFYICQLFGSGNE